MSLRVELPRVIDVGLCLLTNGQIHLPGRR